MPTGFAALDAELPGGGWPTGASPNSCRRTKASASCASSARRSPRSARTGERLAWIAPPYLPYAPALAAAGIALAQVLIVRTRSARDTLWAVEQALRSAACGAVLAWPGDGEVRRAAAPAARGREHAGARRAVPPAARPPPKPRRRRCASRSTPPPAGSRCGSSSAAARCCERPIAIDLGVVPMQLDSAVPAAPAARSAHARACHA